MLAVRAHHAHVMRKLTKVTQFWYWFGWGHPVAAYARLWPSEVVYMFGWVRFTIANAMCSLQYLFFACNMIYMCIYIYMHAYIYIYVYIEIEIWYTHGIYYYTYIHLLILHMVVHAIYIIYISYECNIICIYYAW